MFSKVKSRQIMLVLGAVALAIVGIVLADVIYVYTGTINVATAKTPLTFSAGPNAYPSNSAAQPYLNTTTSYSGFTVTLAATNASGAYYYQAVTMTVNTAGYLYVSSIGTSGSNILNSMTIYIQNTSGGTVCSFTVISNSAPATTPSSTCSLSAGTYYISILAYFNTPVLSGSSESVTVNFGYNVISSTSVPIP